MRRCSTFCTVFVRVVIHVVSIGFHSHCASPLLYIFITLVWCVYEKVLYSPLVAEFPAYRVDALIEFCILTCQIEQVFNSMSGIFAEQRQSTA